MTQATDLTFNEQRDQLIRDSLYLLGLTDEDL
jgi:hypothetical protein